jgi:hypothetical protein
MKEFKADATDKSIDVFIMDSASSVGAGKTGLVYNTAGLVCYYRRQVANTPVAIPLVTQTVAGAHTDGGFVQINATTMPGVYRLDLPDAAIASGVSKVTVMLHSASGMAPVVTELQLRDTTPSTSALEAADILLMRNLASVETGAANGSLPYRHVLQALRFLRNKWSISGGTLTVTKEDDTTSSWSAAITTTAGNPISTVDPA